MVAPERPVEYRSVDGERAQVDLADVIARVRRLTRRR